MALSIFMCIAIFSCNFILHTPGATAATVTRNIPGLYGASRFTSYADENGEYSLFPPNRSESGSTSNDQFFSDNMDFTTFQNRILIGAADNLYILDLDLNPVQNGVLHWTAHEIGVSWCSRDRRYSEQASYYCRNHIRVYSRYPDNPDLLYVCGTQSITIAKCRAVNVSGGSFVSAYPAYNVTQRILSVNPDYPSYGRFRNRPGDSTSFISWYIYQRGVSYLYAFEIQDIKWNASSQSLQNTYKYGKLDNWISEPMYIVDFVDLSYELAEATTTRNFDYYYAFVRERNSYNLPFSANAEPGTLSFAVRVCQDDPGVSYSDGNTSPSFGTTLKARLFCDFEGPNTGDNPLAAKDMRYNNIWSVTFSKSGVDGRIGTEETIMYAAFSGPLTGPAGSAICTFSADPLPFSSTQSNEGLFDTFKEDIILTRPDGFTVRNHEYFDCRNRSRPAEGNDIITSRNILLSEGMNQISGNPLLVLDGFYVTSMTTDTTCVVMQSDRGRCQVLDVLFAGTSQGRVLKIWGGGQTLPKVIAEEISLERDVYVRSLRVRAVNEAKFIYASTMPQLYKISMSRCGRHQNLSICIASRDPYCVWNGMSDACELADLNSTRPVPPYILQNIFEGLIPNIVNVTLASSEYAVVEGGTIDLEILGNSTLPDGLLSVSLYQGDSRISGPHNVTGFTAAAERTNTTVPVEIPDDQQFLGTQNYRVCLQTGDYSAVLFYRKCANVTVYDDDASNVSLAKLEYEVVEGGTLDVMILTNNTVPDGLVTLSLYQGENRINGPLSIKGLSTVLTVPITFPNDKQFSGRQVYSLQLHAGSSGAVVFYTETATVTATDDDGFFAQVGLQNLKAMCKVWKTTRVDSKLKALDEAITVGIGGGFSIERVGLFCPNSAALAAVYRFNVTTQNSNAPDLAKALRAWVIKDEKINPYSFTVDGSCVSEIISLEQDLCQSVLVGAVLPSSSSLSAAVIGVAVMLALALVVNILLVMTLIRCYFYKKSLSQDKSIYQQPARDSEERNGKDVQQNARVSRSPTVETERSSSNSVKRNGKDLQQNGHVSPSTTDDETGPSSPVKLDLASNRPLNLHFESANQGAQNGGGIENGGTTSPVYINSAAPLIGKSGENIRESPWSFQKTQNESPWGFHPNETQL